MFSAQRRARSSSPTRTHDSRKNENAGAANTTPTMIKAVSASSLPHERLLYFIHQRCLLFSTTTTTSTADPEQGTGSAPPPPGLTISWPPAATATADRGSTHHESQQQEKAKEEEEEGATIAAVVTARNIVSYIQLIGCQQLAELFQRNGEQDLAQKLRSVVTSSSQQQNDGGAENSSSSITKDYSSRIMEVLEYQLLGASMRRARSIMFGDCPVRSSVLLPSSSSFLLVTQFYVEAFSVFLQEHLNMASVQAIALAAGLPVEVLTKSLHVRVAAAGAAAPESKNNSKNKKGTKPLKTTRKMKKPQLRLLLQILMNSDRDSLDLTKVRVEDSDSDWLDDDEDAVDAATATATGGHGGDDDDDDDSSASSSEDDELLLRRRGTGNNNNNNNKNDKDTTITTARGAKQQHPRHAEEKKKKGQISSSSNKMINVVRMPKPEKSLLVDFIVSVVFPLKSLGFDPLVQGWKR